MPDTYHYPAEIERDEDGRYVVAFPDFGWGATDGATRDEALLEAKDLAARADRNHDSGGRGPCPSRRAPASGDLLSSRRMCRSP